MDQQIGTGSDYDVARRALEGLRDRDGGSVTTLGVRVSYGITGAADMGPGGVGWKVGELVTQDLDTAVAEVVRVARHAPVDAPTPPRAPERTKAEGPIEAVRSWIGFLRNCSPRQTIGVAVYLVTNTGIRDGLGARWCVERMGGELSIELGRLYVSVTAA